MADILDPIRSAAERDKTVKQSAVTLLTLLAEKLRTAAGDPVAVAAIADALDAQSQSLADAIVANTPAEPA